MNFLKNRGLRATAAAVTATLALVACGGNSQRAAPNAPLASSASAASANPSAATGSAAAPTNLVTSNYHLVPGLAVGNNVAGMEPDQKASRDKIMAGVKATKARIVRFDLIRGNIEYAGAGQYDWADYDAPIQAAVTAGSQVLLVVSPSTKWDRDATCPKDKATCPPVGLDGVKAFVKAAAKRYSNAPYNVLLWEAGNETNFDSGWWPKANPTTYVAFANAVAETIVEVNPRAKVGTASVGTADPGKGMNQVDYVDAMLTTGLSPKISWIGVHPSAYPQLPGDAGDNGWNRTFAREGRSIYTLVVSKAPNLEMWVTELTAPVNGDGAVSAEQQKQTLIKAFDLLAGYQNVGPVLWYNCVDDAEGGFGLMDASGNRRPVYDAFTAQTAK